MSMAFSLMLIAAGAILAFAVDYETQGVNIQTVGIILMVVGIIGLAFSLLFIARLAPFMGRERRIDDRVDPRDHL